MKVICTTCSKRKRQTPGLLPARRRYLSQRIRHVLDQAERSGRPALILSGRYGLLSPSQRIPWYHRVLTEGDVETFVPTLVEQLRSRQVTAVVFHARPRRTAGWRPYYEVLERACRHLGIRFEVKVLGASFL